MARRRPDLGLMLLLAAALGQAISFPAVGAVRECGAPVTGLGSGGNEAAAKKVALDDWKTKAAALGEGYTSWRLATNRFLECKPDSSGSVVCAARGAPCTIEQAPATRELRKNRLDI